MRRLFPDPCPNVDVADAYGRLRRVGERPSVRMNMIASADGAASLNDRTAGLGGDSDHALFAALRSLADMIVVGAGTVRAESYGPARLGDPARARREAWGLPPVPPIAVITRSCDLDWQAPFFTAAEQRPLVVTTANADTASRDRAATVADVIVAGDTAVDLPLALQALADRGVDNVLAEGGPHVSAQLTAAGLLDELCLTVAPMVVAGGASRILNGPELDGVLSLKLCEVLESRGYLFLRYRPPREAQAPSVAERN